MMARLLEHVLKRGWDIILGSVGGKHLIFNA